ncbi:molecular chaperone [Natrialbaceae archaeon A-chndr2]
MTESLTTRGQGGADMEPETVASVYGLLARCFEQPDDATIHALESGTLVEAIASSARDIDVETEAPSPPEEPLESYLETFEGFDGPSAPPVASVYKPWWDGTIRGVLSGPPAHDMERRYQAIDAEIPPEYQPDHIALLLEYGSLLLEDGAKEAYRDFHRTHFDWIESFRERVEETCRVPFYVWAVRTLETVLHRTASEFDCVPATGGEP